MNVPQPSGLRARARAFGRRIPVRTARSIQLLVFGLWVAGVATTGALLGGGGGGGLLTMLANSILIAASAVPVGLMALFASIPVVLLLYLLRHVWTSMPDYVLSLPAPIIGAVLMPLFLSSDLGADVPYDMHPVGYWILVLVWCAGGLAALLPTFEVIDWFEPPRTLPAVRPLPRWTDPEPDEAFWSPTAVVGWRGWTWSNGALHGMWLEWPTPSLTAGCRHGCEKPPRWSCTCGIYATMDRNHVTHGNVLGEVELTGRVVEHEHGYRAQHARILTLYAPRHIAKQVAEAYPDVEVIPT